jgi:hypothetical protein
MGDDACLFVVPDGFNVAAGFPRQHPNREPGGEILEYFFVDHDLALVSVVTTDPIWLV